MSGNRLRVEAREGKAHLYQLAGAVGGVEGTAREDEEGARARREGQAGAPVVDLHARRVQWLESLRRWRRRPGTAASSHGRGDLVSGQAGVRR